MLTGLAAYQGTAVKALTLLAKGTTKLSFAVSGGETYYIAAAVPTNAVGDVLLSGGISPDPSTHAVRGNLLREPSWEGTAIREAQYWGMSAGVGGRLTNQAGTYQAVVSSAFGTATSAPVTLTVESPTEPGILWQPYGDTVGVGGYYNFSVVAAGTLPLSYQWLKDDGEIVGATNRTLAFASVDFTNAGTYTVRVQNDAGIVWSLGARLVVTSAIDGGGGLIDFRNAFFSFTGIDVDAPVFDIDGVTKLKGSNFLAQLYGGPSLELLRPVGQPSPFLSGFGAGYFYSQIVALPTVPPGSNAVLQVRAWEGSKGSTYEAARALGGKFGKSELLTLAVGGGLMPPANLDGLQSFRLRAGMPQFASGEIAFVERQPENVVVWSHRGEPGFRYVIEKSTHGFEWRPYLVITNATTTATFTDSANSGSAVSFYRSRILD